MPMTCRAYLTAPAITYLPTALSQPSPVTNNRTIGYRSTCHAVLGDVCKRSAAVTCTAKLRGPNSVFNARLSFFTKARTEIECKTVEHFQPLKLVRF